MKKVMGYENQSEYIYVLSLLWVATTFLLSFYLHIFLFNVRAYEGIIFKNWKRKSKMAWE